MEEAEDIYSHSSPGESDSGGSWPSPGGSDSGGSWPSPRGSDSHGSWPSPSPSPLTGGMSEEIKPAASAPPSSPRPDDSNALALAITVEASTGERNNSSNSPRDSGSKRADWSEGATEVLIDAWGERHLERNKGNLKHTDWKQLAEAVSSRENNTKTPKTVVQCRHRIDKVKKMYKQEKAKTAASNRPSRWVFFKKLDRLIGSTVKILTIHTRKRSILHQHQAKKPTRADSRRHFKKTNASESEPESESEYEPEDSASSSDSLPPRLPHKRFKAETKKETGQGGSIWDELARAMPRFGEAYENVENAKFQQLIEMEKERMKFIKDLEVQRMQFFVNAHLAITKLRHEGNEIPETKKNN